MSTFTSSSLCLQLHNKPAVSWDIIGLGFFGVGDKTENEDKICSKIFIFLEVWLLIRLYRQRALAKAVKRHQPSLPTWEVKGLIPHPFSTEWL